MSARTIDLRLTDEEIRILHLPVPGYPSSLNTPCQCPVCRVDPNVQRVPPDAVVTGTISGRVKREPVK